MSYRFSVEALLKVNSELLNKQDLVLEHFLRYWSFSQNDNTQQSSHLQSLSKLLLTLMISLNFTWLYIISIQVHTGMVQLRHVPFLIYFTCLHLLGSDEKCLLKTTFWFFYSKNFAMALPKVSTACECGLPLAQIQLWQIPECFANSISVCVLGDSESYLARLRAAALVFVSQRLRYLLQLNSVFSVQFVLKRPSTIKYVVLSPMISSSQF